MIVGVAGTRDIEDYDLVASAIRDSNYEVTLLVHGGARGVDKLAGRYSLEVLKRRPRVIEVTQADYDAYGAAAPLHRNTRIVRVIDALVAIWDGKSRDTLDIINKARSRGLPTYVVRHGELAFSPRVSRTEKGKCSDEPTQRRSTPPAAS